MTAAVQPSSRPPTSSAKAHEPEPKRRGSAIEPKLVPQTAGPQTADVVATGGGQIWARVMGEVSAGQMRSILQSAQELWEENGRAFLRPTPSFRVSAERKIDEIRDLVRSVAGPGVEVELVEPRAEQVGEAKVASGGNNEPTAAFDVADDPLVQRTAQAFGAKIVNVQRKGTGNA